MFKKLLVIATLAAGLISTQASAAFVSTDWKVAGDKGAVLDSETGIEWLRLDQTYGLSMLEVKASLTSGNLVGWRLPNASEIETLFRNIYPMISNPYFSSASFASGGGYNTSVNNASNLFRQLFANVSNQSGNARGAYYDAQGKIRHWGPYSTSMFGLSAKINGSSGGQTSTTTGGFTESSKGSNLGYFNGIFLVSDGGVTLSSINDPLLNLNNPNAPINAPVIAEPVNPADVPVPAGLAVACILMLMFCARRKAA